MKSFWFFTVLFCIGLTSRAQLITNSGTEFWFAFPETYDKAAAVYWVNITGNTTTTGTVEVPGQGWSQNFNLTAGQVVRVFIPSNHATNIGSDTLFNTAIRITANDDIVAFAVTYHQFRHEAALILPNVAIGQRYRAMTYSAETKNGLQESEFVIAATGDTAEVQITLAADIAGGKTAGSTYTVTIPPNHVYQAQSLADTDDLTGSLIESINGEDIAVYAGNVWSTIVCSPNSDPLLEAMFPTNTWGRDYFLLPTPSVGKDYIRILADKDTTEIYRDGVLMTTLSAGQFFDDTISVIRRYTSNKPVAAAHFLVTGQGGCTGYTNTDPSMITLNPTEQMFLDSISFFAVDTNEIDSHFVHVLTHTTDTGLMFKDGVQMTGWTTFTQDSSFAYKTLRVQPGSHRLETSTGCGFIAYSMGIGNAVSYGYATGASLIDLDKGITYTNFGSSDTICKNDSVLFSTYMREPPISITWYFGDGDSSTLAEPTHQYINTGTYYVEAHVIYRCIPYDTIRDTLVIPEFSSIYSVTTEDVSCNGGADGEFRVQGSYIKRIELAGPVQQQFLDTAFNLTQGFYTATVVDSTGCANDTSVLITEPPPLVVDSILSDSVLCFGDTTGKARVFTSGGSGQHTYQWDASAMSQTTFQAGSLAQGTYGVTITDSLMCTIDSSIAVEQPVILSFTAAQSNVMCFGDSSGKAWVSPTGGTIPYSYSWNVHGTTVTTDTAFNLNADTFSVIITDRNGCREDSLFTLTQPDSLIVDAIVLYNVGCFGDSSGSAVVNLGGGTTPYSFSWSANVLQSLGDSAFALPSGSYSVVGNDSNGCTITDSFSIAQPLAAISLTVDGTNVLCNGDSTGKAWARVSGGVTPYAYNWSVNAGGQTSDTAFTLHADTFYIQVSDSNSCMEDTLIAITEPPPLVVDTIYADSVLCYGDTNGTAFINVSGGSPSYVYQWDVNTGAQMSTQAVNLFQGVYQVSVTDTNGCMIDTSIAVDQPDSISLSGSQSNVLCFGDSTGQAWILPSGGSIPYSLSWNVYGTFLTTDTVSQLIADTFRVTVTDRNGCSKDSLFSIQEPPVLSLDSFDLTHILCYGDLTGISVANVSGGTTPYSYSWSSNVTSSGMDSAYSLAADTFSVQVTDSNACLDSGSFVIVQPPALSIAVSAQELRCHNDASGKAWTQIGGGVRPYTYLWSVNSGNQVGDTAFALDAGTYQVTSTDSNGCMIDTSIVVIEPDTLSIFLNGRDVSCFGFTDAWIKLTANGGRTPYNYQWSPTGGGQGTDSLHSLPVGTYDVLLTDTSGCEIRDTMVINQPTRIQMTLANSVGDTICFGDQITLTPSVIGGVTPYQFLWNNGSTDSVLRDNPRADSVYMVIVTDANNCPGDTIDLHISVIDVTNEIVTLSSNSPVCFGEETEITSTHNGQHPPYIIAWSPNLFSGIGTFNHLFDSVATVRLTVDDQCGGTTTRSVNIVINPLPEYSLPIEGFAGCEDLVINPVNAAHAVGYTYLWEFGDGGTSSLAAPQYTYQEPGLYDLTLTVTNQFGCRSSNGGETVVDVWPRPEASIFAERVTAPSNQAIFTLEDESFRGVSREWFYLDTLLGDSSIVEINLGDSGIFEVMLMSYTDKGCSDSTYQTLIVTPSHKVEAPNVFSPNRAGPGSGAYDPDNPSNQVFFPFVEDAVDYELMIFDRWGELIFHSTDVNYGWNGYYKGRLSPQDSYVWKLRVRFTDGFEKTVKGDITLLH